MSDRLVDVVDAVADPTNLRQVLLGLVIAALACTIPDRWLRGGAAGLVAAVATALVVEVPLAPPASGVAVAAAGGLFVVAAVGVTRLGAPVVRAGAVVAVGVAAWVAVPENDPVLIAASVAAGLGVAWRRSPNLLAAPVLVLGWAALHGATPGPVRLAGAVAVFAPLAVPAVVALRPWPGRWPMGPWFVAYTAASGMLAARWIAVSPSASRARVLAIAAAAALVATVVADPPGQREGRAGPITTPRS